MGLKILNLSLSYYPGVRYSPKFGQRPKVDFSLPYVLQDLVMNWEAPTDIDPDQIAEDAVMAVLR